MEEAKRYTEMWRDILCFLDTMYLDVEQEGDQIEILRATHHAQDEDLLVFLARFFVIYERQCSNIKETKLLMSSFQNWFGNL